MEIAPPLRLSNARRWTLRRVGLGYGGGYDAVRRGEDERQRDG